MSQTLLREKEEINKEEESYFFKSHCFPWFFVSDAFCSSSDSGFLGYFWCIEKG